jgi:hypothetical protein
MLSAGNENSREKRFLSRPAEAGWEDAASRSMVLPEGADVRMAQRVCYRSIAV